MLISLIGDLIRDEHKQRAFAKDPHAAAVSAGLTDEERTALASRDLDSLARLIAKDLNRIIPSWAAPRLRITPPMDPAQGCPGDRIAILTVKGQWFAAPEVMEAQLEGDHLTAPVPVFVKSVTDAMMPESVLVGSVELPADAKPGTCTLRLTRKTEDPPSTDTVPGAFTIVAR